MDAYSTRKTKYDRILESVAGISDGEKQAKADSSKKEYDEFYENASFSAKTRSAIRRSNARKAMLENGYADRVAVLGLTEALTKAAIKALPLDEQEYAKLNPHYKDQMGKAIAEAFNGSVSAGTASTATKVFMDCIERTAPAPKDGMFLEDDELKNRIANELDKSVEVQAAIDNLSNAVQNNVAGIVANDQVEASRINSAVDGIKTAKDIAVEQASQDQQAADQAQADQEAQQQQSAAEAQADDPASYDPNAIQDPSAMAAPDQQAIQAPAAGGQDVNISIGGTTVTVHNESCFVRNIPVRGIVEGIALSESQKMIAEGKTYDADLALANAVRTITVLETLDASGLFHIGKAGYARMLEGIKKTSACKGKCARVIREDDLGVAMPEVKGAQDAAMEGQPAAAAQAEPKVGEKLAGADAPVSNAGFPDDYIVPKRAMARGYDSPCDPSSYVNDAGK
jgi:DNA polymerase III alpha subunit (gram-positive type)